MTSHLHIFILRLMTVCMHVLTASRSLHVNIKSWINDSLCACLIIESNSKPHMFLKLGLINTVTGVCLHTV